MASSPAGLGLDFGSSSRSSIYPYDGSLMNPDRVIVRPEHGFAAVTTGIEAWGTSDVGSSMVADYLEITDIPGSYEQADEHGGEIWEPVLDDLGRSLSERTLSDDEVFGKETAAATLSGVHFGPRRAWVIHEGDGRVYRLRANHFEQMTTDGTLLQDYLAAGKLTPEEAASFPHADVLCTFLGSERKSSARVRPTDYRLGDTFLICSRGLFRSSEEGVVRSIHEVVETVLISTVSRALPNLDDAAARLTAHAMANGAQYASVVAIRVGVAGALSIEPDAGDGR